jgi:hypothetical protein
MLVQYLSGKELFIYLHSLQLLNGTVSRNFRPSFFFHKSTPHKDLIHGLRSLFLRPLFLRPLFLRPHIRLENQQHSNFSGVNDHTEIFLAGSLILQKPGFRKPLHWSVSIASQTCNDLRNSYSPELLFLWWLTDKNTGGKKPCMLSL